MFFRIIETISGNLAVRSKVARLVLEVRGFSL
jgi:hypothetical protein